jgi:hypothetical protein
LHNKPFETYVCAIVRFPSEIYLFLARYIILNPNELLSHVFREYQKRRRKLYIIKYITDYNVRLRTESVFSLPVIYVVLFIRRSRNYPYMIILHSTINYLPSSKLLSKKSVSAPLIIHSIILSRRNCLKRFAFESL